MPLVTAGNSAASVLRNRIDAPILRIARGMRERLVRGYWQREEYCFGKHLISVFGRACSVVLVDDRIPVR
jgi:hypothetical protein